MARNRAERVIRRQRPVSGGRIPTGSALLPAIRRKVEALADRHGVSRSWVVAVLLADSLGIDEQERYGG